jgi:hypothetical protein
MIITNKFVMDEIQVSNNNIFTLTIYVRVICTLYRTLPKSYIEFEKNDTVS